jgi:hypothetical protein
MTRIPQNPSPAEPAPAPANADACSPDHVEMYAVIVTPRTEPSLDRYDLGQLFLEWTWSARFPGGWGASVQVLARTLRGLEQAGLIERRTIRRVGHPTHHGFVLTNLGHEAVNALSGDWMKDGQ